MNDHLKISPHGLRLIQDFEGAPRLKARLCEGGKYELGWGCTYYPDNSPVKEGDTIDLSFAPVMLQHAATVTENAVKRLVHIPLTQPQFDGLCGFVYNVGEANAATSTVIRETNAGRFEDAAAAFGMWVFATKAGYKQALRGLLRRRYAEACTYLGYHYTEACADEAVALQREKPAKLPGADRVLYKTPFANILRVAQHYPLPESPEPAHAQSPVLVPTVLERVEVAPAPVEGSPLPDLASQATILKGELRIPLPAEFEAGDELVLNRPAATEASTEANGTASAPEATQPVPAQARVPHTDSNTGVSPPASAGRPDPIAPSPPVVLPSPLPPPKPPPKLPDPPIPIGQQTSAVDATRKSEDWSESAKSMVYSRRFWGLLLVVAGRGYMLWTGSNAALGAVSDPIVTEMFSGFMVMMVGEIVQHWGSRKATRPLK
jgi:lysozyme